MVQLVVSGLMVDCSSFFERTSLAFSSSGCKSSQEKEAHAPPKIQVSNKRTHTDTHRHTDRQTDTQTDTHRHTDRHTQTHTNTHKHTQTNTNLEAASLAHELCSGRFSDTGRSHQQCTPLVVARVACAAACGVSTWRWGEVVAALVVLLAGASKQCANWEPSLMTGTAPPFKLTITLSLAVLEWEVLVPVLEPRSELVCVASGTALPNHLLNLLRRVLDGPQFAARGRGRGRVCC